MFYYVLTSEGILTQVETEKRFELKDYYRLINCDCISYVKCIDRSTNMIIDDEGKLKDKPINVPATMLYGALPYDCIVGDVILCTERVVNEIGERDFYGFEESQIKYIRNMIAKAIKDYIKKGGDDIV